MPSEKIVYLTQIDDQIREMTDNEVAEYEATLASFETVQLTE
jgi:hypothetical protein